ncbi:putative 2-aminoethylphosphonate ABC transporter permease subunit [Candidatus Sororendozoicomonas aggregata]|uniref:putative 2-aminoethylphosphonate ABC transporter permease subunit n=1 Tax=Candidatus Sororendozoicomonas aggregata TaxID=3073239 RepID=UPI002ED2F364
MNMIRSEPATPSLSMQKKRVVSKDKLVLGTVITAITLYLVTTVLLPLLAMLARSVQDSDGHFVGLANFYEYLNNPALTVSVSNTLTVGATITTIVVLLAFLYAYALTRTCMPFKSAFKVLGMLPILAPSLLPAISMIYLFGNQGVATDLLMGHSIYGLPGIVIGLVFWTFPHALLILNTALTTADARLYESARVMRSSPFRTFITVTLPAAKFGLISTVTVIFTLVVTDFGVAKVVGGQYNVLATDIYKQVIGQQNFAMGAVTSVFLLLPAVLAFIVNRKVQKKQKELFSSKSIAFKPTPNSLKDSLFFIICSLILLGIVAVIGMAIYGSLVTFWPWNMQLSLHNYQFDAFSAGGWTPFFTSLKLAFGTAIVGTTIIFITAYNVEKSTMPKAIRGIIQAMAMLPVAVPGMVLGLGYIFFFNMPENPLNLLYGTLTLLIINTVAHYFTVGHLTSLAALKKLPAEIEQVAASLKIPQYKAFMKVSMPFCLPALLDISIYLFVNAMTTTSAVVFLYSADFMPASVAVLSMEDAGQIGPASAMAVLILLTATSVKLLHLLFGKVIIKYTEAYH